MAYLSRAKLEFGPIENTPTYTSLHVVTSVLHICHRSNLINFEIPEGLITVLCS